MELVYLWVEAYKNIRNQGFNFSPRFECEFKDCNLTICDKKEKECKNNEYLENFFGENINVTAIVGENGTGKSSILETLLENKIRQYSLIKGLRISLYLQENKWLLRFDDESKDEIYIKDVNKDESINLSNLINWKELKNYDEINYKTIFYKNILDNNQILSNDKIDISLTTHSQLESGLYNYYSKNTQKIVSLLKNKSIKLEFALPDKVYLEKSYFDLNEEIKKILQNKRYNNYGDKLLNILNQTRTFRFDLWLIHHINNYSNDKFPEFEINKISDEKTFIEYFEKISEADKNLINNVSKGIDNFKENGDKYILEIENISNDFIKDYTYIDPKGWLFRFAYGNISLSSGQYYFLLFFSNIFHALNNAKESKNFIIYIDEGDLTLHPQWQKAFLNQIIKFLEKNFTDYQFHLVFTTHSPFLLSDLPKENVIFLEKYKKDEDENQKEGNCKNVSKDLEIKTFGANIHTLLSDGFFMSDGLMGEFAKSKIEEIKKFYELVKKCEKIITKSENVKNTIKNIYQGYEPNFRNIHNIIGEAFLKTIIGNYLDELEQFFDNDTYKNKKRDNLLKQFSPKELEEYLESLKNAKN